MSSTIDRATRDALERERDFLLRSIEDLEQEHAAGDVSDDDFRLLRDDYVARTAATVRALSASATADEAERDSLRTRSFRRLLGLRRTRRTLVGVGIVCVLGVIAIAAASFAGVRFPGESATGTVSLPRATQIRDDLAEAALLSGSGNQAQAVALYGEVLSLDPRNATALSYRGWLIRIAGRATGSVKAIALGDASISRAVKVAPRFPDARAFEAVALFQDRHDTTGALGQIRAFVADRPTPGLLAAVGPSLASIEKSAGVPVSRQLRPFANLRS